MVCIPNCDKIVPGMLMAAMRVNIPTIFVSGGPMAAGVAQNPPATSPPICAGDREIDLISVFKGVGELQTGKITEAELKKLEQTACPTCGSCSGMFTANSMNCLCEALGMALPGNGTILAVSKEREALYDARRSRHRQSWFRHDLKPRDIATVEAFDNALTLDVAMGGSTNTILHTLAIAREAGIPYDIKRIDDISRAPVLCKVSPSSTYHVQDVHRAGGIPAILSELFKVPGLMKRDCLTVTGKTLEENVATAASRTRRSSGPCRTPTARTAGSRSSTATSRPTARSSRPPGSTRRC